MAECVALRRISARIPRISKASERTSDRGLDRYRPLVAILSRNDAYHNVYVEALHKLPAPLFSCWPVITEAAWLLRTSPRLIQQLLRSIDGAFLELLPLAGTEGEAIAALMKRYADIRPQLADAALVYLAHREHIDTIFTLDRRDFSIYGSGRKRNFRIVPEVL